MSGSESFPTPVDNTQHQAISQAAPLEHQPGGSAHQQGLQVTQDATQDSGAASSQSSAGDEVWFSIRDIINERRHEGKVYYLIDWEDDWRTGRPYEPSWEPAENVAEVAIRAWLAKQGRGSQFTSQQSSQEDSSVPIANWRRWRRTGTQRRWSQEQDSTSPAYVTQVGPATPHQGQAFVVALPRDPEVDTSDYVFWPASPEAVRDDQDIVVENYIPRSQDVGFHGAVRSGLSQPEIQDSQEVSTETQSQSQSRLQLHGHLQSNTRSTVPDSEGLQDDGLAEVESATLREVALTQDLHLPTEIPSHQPERAQHYSATLSSTSQSVSGESQTHLRLTGPIEEVHPPVEPEFLTQVSFDSQVPLLSSQVCLNSIGEEASTTAERSSGSNRSAAPPLYISQAAQIIPALNTNYDDLTFQTQYDFDVYDDRGSEDELIVPETVRRPVAESHTRQREQQQQQDSQGSSSQALSEVSGNDRARKSDKGNRERVHEPSLATQRSSGSASRSEIQGIVDSIEQPHQPELLIRDNPASAILHPAEDNLRPVTPTNMDNTDALTTPLSVKEKLRLIREQHLSQTPELNEHGELPIDHGNGGAAPLSLGEEQAKCLQGGTTEQHDPVAIPSPSLALEPAELAPQDMPGIPQYDQTGGTTTIHAIAIDPAAVVEQSSMIDQSEAAPEPMNFDQPLALHVSESQETGDHHSQPLSNVQNVSLADLTLVCDVAPVTLDPAALTLSIEGDVEGSPSAGTDDVPAMPARLDQASKHFDSSNDHDEADINDGYPRDLLPEIPTAEHEYVVTLPFFSSSRPQYNDIIREHEQAIQQYTSCFSVTPHEQPSVGLIARIDNMFTRLFDICDTPPFLDTLPTLSAEDITKHVVGTNSKMCFIFELLLALREAGACKNLTILVRPGQIADLLTSVVQAGGYNLVLDGQWPDPADTTQSLINVAILSTAHDVATFPSKPDVYIVYDHTFDHELIASRGPDAPLVLVLTLVASIQHLNMRVSEKMESLERKNFLILAMAKAMRYIEEPDSYLPGIDKPPELALEFAQHVLNAEYDDFHYEGQHIPEDVFQDLHQSSSQVLQTQDTSEVDSGNQPRQGLKRGYNDYEDFTAKRPRLSQPPLTGVMNHVSEPLRELLGDDPTLDISEDSKVIRVSVDRLETLSEMIIQLQDQLRESRQREEDFRKLSDRSKREVDGYVASVRIVQAKFMDALKDRGTFEDQCKKAQQEAEKLRSSLQSSRQEASAWREKNYELTQKLKEAHESLESGANPELARVSRLELEVQEARESVAKAEKRATLAQETMEYSKDAYQNASRTLMELQSENQSLAKQLDELRARASDNVQKVNQVQAKSEVNNLLRLLEEQKNIVRDREFELGRMRDDMRLKSARRETRQSSVPRSPRPMSGVAGIMSPRGQSRGAGGGGGYPGASSRGTSPVPPPPAMASVFDSSGGTGSGFSSSAGGGGSGGMSGGLPLFNQPAGNSRFAHLRE